MFCRFCHQNHKVNCHNYEIHKKKYVFMEQVEYYANLYDINVDFTLTKSTDYWWKLSE